MTAIEKLFDSLLSVWPMTGSIVKEACFSGIIIAWTSIMAAWTLKVLPEEVNPENQSREVYYRFLSDVQNNLKRERKVAFYASRANLSVRYFSQVIMKHSGQKPSEIIREFTISEAKRLLSTRNLSIQQVSLELGFPSPSFLAKYFRTATGMTPREFQKTIVD